MVLTIYNQLNGRHRKMNCMTPKIMKMFCESHLLYLPGSWTVDNYKERLEAMEREKMERKRMIEEYLQQQQQADHDQENTMIPFKNHKQSSS